MQDTLLSFSLKRRFVLLPERRGGFVPGVHHGLFAVWLGVIRRRVITRRRVRPRLVGVVRVELRLRGRGRRTHRGDAPYVPVQTIRRPPRRVS